MAMLSSNQNSIKNLRVPDTSIASKSGVNSIIEAYKSQSKVDLGMTDGMGSHDGLARGRDIPLSMLRPKTPTSYDENGKPVYSKSRAAEDMAKNKSIASAYRKMSGEVDESELDEDYIGEMNIEENDFVPAPKDVGELVGYLRTLIKNYETNLKMLKSFHDMLTSQE